MRRPRSVEPRRVIFIGVEGPSDRAFVRFLGKCCDCQGLHLHLEVKPAKGGASVVVVQAAASYASRRPSFVPRLVLLDEDRIHAIWSRCRSHRVHKRVRLNLAKPESGRTSPEAALWLRASAHSSARRDEGVAEGLAAYSKSLTAAQLDQRFGLSDVLRAAEYDGHLRKLLEMLGLSGLR